MENTHTFPLFIALTFATLAYQPRLEAVTAIKIQSLKTKKKQNFKILQYKVSFKINCYNTRVYYTTLLTWSPGSCTETSYVRPYKSNYYTQFVTEMQKNTVKAQAIQQSTLMAICITVYFNILHSKAEYLFLNNWH